MADCMNCGESGTVLSVELFRTEDVTMYDSRVAPAGGIVRNEPVLTGAGYCTHCGILEEAFPGG